MPEYLTTVDEARAAAVAVEPVHPGLVAGVLAMAATAVYVLVHAIVWAVRA